MLLFAVLCFLCSSFRGHRRLLVKDPRLGLGSLIYDATANPKSQQVMRRCLQLQPGSLGWRRLPSRSLATSTGEASWCIAVQNKNDSVNALVYVAPDDAATISEGPLQGMTVAVKDNICTKNMPTTCSSAMLRSEHSLLTVLACALALTICTLDFKSPFDATVVQLLSDSGATIIGKTNCDEFGMGYACTSFVGHLELQSKPQVSQYPFSPWIGRQPVPTSRERRGVGCA